MDLWVACLLLVVFIAGMVILLTKMKGKDRKAGYITGVLCLGIMALATIGYILLTAFFVGSIK